MRSRWRTALPFVISLAALVTAETARAQPPLRIGSEFQVTTYTSSRQDTVRVAAGPMGGFVVVWMSYGQDGDQTAVYARRFASSGSALGGELRISSYTEADQGYPAIATTSDGDFLVVWTDQFHEAFGSGVFLRRFDSAGAPQAPEVVVNSYTLNAQALPAIAIAGDDSFVVVWQSQSQDGDDTGIFAQRFDSAGAAQAKEFQVNTYTSGMQSRPDVRVASGGDFVVAWNSEGEDGSGSGIFARRFDSAGTALATEFQVNSYTAERQVNPRVAVNGAAGFVVVWQSLYQDGSQYGLFARRYDSAGTALATELQINSYTSSTQQHPAIAAASNGDFVVTWHGTGATSFELGIFARRFASSGAALGVDFEVDSYTAGYQSYAELAMHPDGDFVVAWNSYEQDGDNLGVFAQRFGTLRPLDVDGNGSTGALTDGLLVLRFMFGFTGTTLTSGAIGGGCTRCDAAAIVPYLTGLGMTLDIDGNGTLGALTDGLLVLRFLFGFTGTTLTSGAVAVNCTRCDAAAIVPDLQGLV